VALVRGRNPNGYFRQMTRLKKLFWLYFLLLIFEGSLRKWVLPQFSAPLLIVRDPVALMIIWEAYRTNKWPKRWSSVIILLTILLLGLFILQIVAGGNPLLVGLYGLRSYLLPFPLIFIIGESLDDEDLRKLGACTLWLLLPMTILAVAQYLAPGSSFVNRGAYEGGSQIGYIGGHVRASGTFSFVIGLTHFGTLAGAFIFYGMVKDGFVKTWMLWAGAFGLMLSIPMTGSRSLVFQLAAILGCVGLCAIMGVSQFGKALRVILPVVIMAFLVSLLPVFSDALRSMTDRFVGAAATEGGGAEGQTLYNRTLRYPVTAIEDAVSVDNWMGIGMGRGAVAVQAFLNGSNEAVAGEDEFSREMGEMGPVIGIAFVLFKLLLAVTVFGRALARAREHEPLALLLIPLAMATLFFGIPEQPTVQGFMVIGMAFCIAAAKAPAQAPAQLLPLALQRQQLLYPRQVRRG
jgi:hypothetical protein